MKNINIDLTKTDKEVWDQINDATKKVNRKPFWKRIKAWLF